MSAAWRRSLNLHRLPHLLMDRFDRIFQLNNILQNSRRPVSHKRLEEQLECSRATVTRTIEDLRDRLNAPLEYDRKANGYFYNQQIDQMFELPGLWFNASEISALLGVQQLLANLQPGLLDHYLDPLRQRIDTILQHEHASSDNIINRIRILRMAARPAGECFQIVTHALAQRKQLSMEYYGRTDDVITQRKISPQRLINYRDNWYLDAWCHLRGALRSFALDAIQSAQIAAANAKEISDEQLDEYYTSAYGIFSGKADKQAVLRFVPECARWISNEQWHPDQQGCHLEDGSYELRIPYCNASELIMDILKYGADVEVMSPNELRQQVIDRLQTALALY